MGIAYSYARCQDALGRADGLVAAAFPEGSRYAQEWVSAKCNFNSAPLLSVPSSGPSALVSTGVVPWSPNSTSKVQQLYAVLPETRGVRRSYWDGESVARTTDSAGLRVVVGCWH